MLGVVHVDLFAQIAAFAALSDESKRTDAFGVVQDAEAKDVPLIPIWEGKQIAAIRDGVEGVDKTFDPAFQFRFWLVTKKES